jgi:hypothetical protein
MHIACHPRIIYPRTHTGGEYLLVYNVIFISSLAPCQHLHRIKLQSTKDETVKQILQRDGMHSKSVCKEQLINTNIFFYYKVLSGITPLLATAIMPVKFLAAHRDLVFTVLEVPLWRASFTTWFRVHIAETTGRTTYLIMLPDSPRPTWSRLQQ